MRTIKTLLLAVTLTVSSLFSANATDSNTEPAFINDEVGKLLKNPKFELEKEVQAYVRLAFNEDNEMVVLFVESDNKMINYYIKSRLNYKKLSETVIDKNKVYILPVRITPSE